MRKHTEAENEKFREEFSDRFYELSHSQMEDIGLSVLAYYGPEGVASMFIESREIENLTTDVDHLIQLLQARKTYR